MVEPDVGQIAAGAQSVEQRRRCRAGAMHKNGVAARDDASGIQRIAPRDFRQGTQVRLRDGPLEGYEGIYMARTGDDRVVILMDIVGKQTRVVVSSGDLEPAW